MLTREAILAKLPAETATIRENLHSAGRKFHKRDLNKLLYLMQAEGTIVSDGGVPPRWSIVTDEIVNNNNNNNNIATTFVLVDCDNRPHCFKNAALLTEKNKDLQVVGFASPTYNFWFPESSYRVKLIQAKELMKDIAEIEMAMFVADQAQQKENKDATFILVSGDKCINTIASVSRYKYGANVIVINTNWDALKMEIE